MKNSIELLKSNINFKDAKISKIFYEATAGLQAMHIFMHSSDFSFLLK